MAHDFPTYKLGQDFNLKLEQFVKSFIRNGFEQFAQEFQNIDEFIECARCDKSGRSDKKLRTSPKEKYLLELVSYKIYDELNKEAFNKTKNTLIVMPDCLSLHNPGCEKEETEYGTFCHLCTPSCQAYKISELAKIYDIPIVFSKRALEKQLEYFSDQHKDLGVIGIACIMMLATGMRTAYEVSIPARGVLLNFTGCDHWNESHFASEFTLTTLEDILEEKYGSRNQKTDD